MKKILAAVLIVLSCSVWAGDYEDAVAAYDKKSYARAIVHFKAAAAQGHVTSQFILGVMYAGGQGVAQDYVQAAHWYKLAAAQGDAYAQMHLGGMYFVGRGVKQDYAETFRLNKLAAAQGVARAQLMLGHIYHEGIGVAQNFIRAHMWFNLSAAQGDQEGLKNRDLIANKMTSQQIAQSQKLARECQARNYKNCD